MVSEIFGGQTTPSILVVSIGADQYTSSKAEVKKQGTSRIFEDKLYFVISSLHCLPGQAKQPRQFL